MVKIHFPELSFREKSYVNSNEIIPLVWCERKMIKDTASHFFSFERMDNHTLIRQKKLSI